MADWSCPGFRGVLRTVGEGLHEGIHNVARDGDVEPQLAGAAARPGVAPLGSASAAGGRDLEEGALHRPPWTRCGWPVWARSASHAGVVAAIRSLEDSGRIVESLDLGPGGYGSLVSRKGVYLHHPNDEYVKAQRSLMEVAHETGDSDRLLVRALTARGTQGLIEHRSVTLGRPAWPVYSPVPATGWSLINTFIKDDVPVDVDEFRRQRIQIIAVMIAFLSSLLALVSARHGP